MRLATSRIQGGSGSSLLALRVHQHAQSTGLRSSTLAGSHSSSNSSMNTSSLVVTLGGISTLATILNSTSSTQRRHATFTLSHTVPHYIRSRCVKACLKSIHAILLAGPREGVLLSDVARELPDEQMEAMEEGLKNFVLSEAKEQIAVRKNPQGKVILCLYSNDSTAVSAGEGPVTSSVTTPVRAPTAPPAPRGAPIPQAPPPTFGVPVAQGPPSSADGSMSPSNYIISLPLVERFLPPRELPGKQAQLLIDLMCKCPLKAFSLLTAITEREHVEALVHVGFNSPITRSFTPISLVAVRKDWRRHIKFNDQNRTPTAPVSSPSTSEEEGDKDASNNNIILYDAEIVETLERLQNVYNDADPIRNFLATHNVFATLNSQYAEQILESDAVLAVTNPPDVTPTIVEDDGSDDFGGPVPPPPPPQAVGAPKIGEVAEEYDVMRLARFVPVEDFIPLEILFPLSGQVSTKDPLQVLLSAPDLFELDNKYAPTAVKFILHDRYIPALFTESLEEISKEVVARCLARRNEKQQRRLGEHKRKIELAKIALSMKMLGRQSIADPRVMSMFVFDIMNENPVELPQIESALFGVSRKSTEGSLQFYHDFENDAYNLFLPPELVASMKASGVASPYMALRAIKQQQRSPVQMSGSGGHRNNRGHHNNQQQQDLGMAPPPTHNTFAHEKWKQVQTLQEQGITIRIPTPCPFVFNQAFYRYAPVYEKFPHLFYVYETAQRNRMISRADLDAPAAAETQRELSPDDILTVMKQAVDGAQQSQTPNAILPFLEEGKQDGISDLITYANIGSVSRQLPLFVCKRIRAMYHGVNKSVFVGYLTDHPKHFEYVLLPKSGTYFVRLRRKGLNDDETKNKK